MKLFTGTWLIFDDELFSINNDRVAWQQLSSASSFGFTVDCHPAALNQQLRLSPGAGDAVPLEELIEPDCVGFVFLRIQNAPLRFR